jgi:hypothetical protein
MKNYTIIFFSFLIILGLQCRKDDMIENQQQYTVKGRLLNSCENPTPSLDNELLSLRSICAFCTIGFELVPITVNEDGTFEFKYKHSSINKNLGLFSYKYYDLVLGIPVNQNIDLGNVYLKNNLYAIVKTKPKRITSKADTLFYNPQDYRGNKLPIEYAIGPFSENQIIDTLFFHSFQIYDSTYLDKDWWLKTNANLQYAIGKNNNVLTLSKVLKPCDQSSEFEVIIR